MTMQTNDPKHGGFLYSFAGQITMVGIALIVIILLASRYVF